RYRRPVVPCRHVQGSTVVVASANVGLEADCHEQLDYGRLVVLGGGVQEGGIAADHVLVNMPAAVGWVREGLVVNPHFEQSGVGQQRVLEEFHFADARRHKCVSRRAARHE